MHAGVLLALFLFVALAPLYGATGRKIVGGWYVVSVDDEDIIRVADYAVEQVEETSNSHYEMGLEKVVSAQKQVVGGMKYNISFILHETNCEKEGHFPVPIGEEPDENKPSYCVVTVFQDCNVVVYERAWEDFIQVNSLACTPSTYERDFSTGLILPEDEPEGRRGARGGTLGKLFGKRHHK